MTALLFLRSHWKLIAITLPFLLLLAHDRRVDWLRGHYKAQWSQTVTAYAVFRAQVKAETEAALNKQKEIAHAADVKHEKELAEVRASADDYKRTHRVRPQTGGSGSTASASADTGVPEESSAAAIVVSEKDFDACTSAAQYALDAHDWAVDRAGGVK